eukprot:2193274-Rhodomonas_salina.4
MSDPVSVCRCSSSGRPLTLCGSVVRPIRTSLPSVPRSSWYGCDSESARVSLELSTRDRKCKASERLDEVNGSREGEGVSWTLEAARVEKG